MPTVSIILPNYNHARYLTQRIDSILNQTYQDFELIILDDCSTDNSREALLKYKDHPKVSHLIFNEQNSGSTFKQWNKGIKLAKGKYIWIAESDDWAERIFLETLVAEFEKNEKVGLVYCHSKLINGEGKETYKNADRNSGESIYYAGKEFIDKKLSLDNSIWNASMMMFLKTLFPSKEQRELYGKMRYCGDWMFYILLAEQDIAVVEVKRTLNNYRIHKNNVSTNAIAEGKDFIEGLDVYAYVKKIQGRKLKTESDWAKKLCRARRHHLFTRNTLQNILSKMCREHKIIYLFYCIFKPLYNLKRKL